MCHFTVNLNVFPAIRSVMGGGVSYVGGIIKTERYDECNMMEHSKVERKMGHFPVQDQTDTTENLFNCLLFKNMTVVGMI